MLQDNKKHCDLWARKKQTCGDHAGIKWERSQPQDVGQLWISKPVASKKGVLEILEIVHGWTIGIQHGCLQWCLKTLKALPASLKISKHTLWPHEKTITLKTPKLNKLRVQTAVRCGSAMFPSSPHNKIKAANKDSSWLERATSYNQSQTQDPRTPATGFKGLVWRQETIIFFL